LVNLVNMNPCSPGINTSSVDNIFFHCAQLHVTFFICLLDLCDETKPKMLPNNYILCTIYSCFATFLWALDSDGGSDDNEEIETWNTTEAIVLNGATMAPSLSRVRWVRESHMLGLVLVWLDNHRLSSCGFHFHHHKVCWKEIDMGNLIMKWSRRQVVFHFSIPCRSHTLASSNINQSWNV